MLKRLCVSLALISVSAAGGFAQTTPATGAAAAVPVTVSAVPQVPPGCHPSYLPSADGKCVPIADNVHCARDGGTGPNTVVGPFKVIGRDEYYLDFDADGTACNRDKQ